MHDFIELADICTTFTLQALEEAEQKIIEEHQTSARTSLVKGLQSFRLSKAFFITGMFSVFEAQLQSSFNCKNGFEKANEILEKKQQNVIKEKFNDLCLAINVIKHGRGDSYDKLVAKAKSLPFRIRLSDEYFFCEGDVTEVNTLVEVNDEFVKYCLDVIKEVSYYVESS